MQGAGPLLWNNLPEYIRNSQSVFILKKKLKSHFIEQYESTLPQLSGHYYVSKLSIDCMKLKVSKMNTFFIPPYLPDQIQVRNISNDGMKITLSRK